MLVLTRPDGRRVSIDTDGLAPPEPPPVENRAETYQRIRDEIFRHSHDQPGECIDRDPV